jgi:hypothetical protein
MYLQHTMRYDNPPLMLHYHAHAELAKSHLIRPILKICRSSNYFLLVCLLSGNSYYAWVGGHSGAVMMFMTMVTNMACRTTTFYTEQWWKLFHIASSASCVLVFKMPNKVLKEEGRIIIPLMALTSSSDTVREKTPFTRTTTCRKHLYASCEHVSINYVCACWVCSAWSFVDCKGQSAWELSLPWVDRETGSRGSVRYFCLRGEKAGRKLQ